MRSVKISARPPDGTRQGKPGVGLFGRNVHLCNDSYGYFNMAINVQAAPFVNRMLHKQNVSYSGSLNVLQLRMAKIRNDPKRKKPNTKNIHALYTNASP